MKRQDFDDLVQRIETQFGGKQPALERSTAAWIRFGLAGILLWLCVLFGLARPRLSGASSSHRRSGSGCSAWASC